MKLALSLALLLALAPRPAMAQTSPTETPREERETIEESTACWTGRSRAGDGDLSYANLCGADL